MHLIFGQTFSHKILSKRKVEKSHQSCFYLLLSLAGLMCKVTCFRLGKSQVYKKKIKVISSQNQKKKRNLCDKILQICPPVICIILAECINFVISIFHSAHHNMELILQAYSLNFANSLMSFLKPGKGYFGSKTKKRLFYF